MLHLRDDVWYSVAICHGKPRRHYFIKTKCAICDKDTFAHLSNYKKYGRAFCSKQCKRISMTGSNNYRWAGGEKFKRGGNVGHILIYKPDHCYARCGYVPKHRVIMEAAIGRILTPSELVHHIDCVPSNNELTNLDIVTSSEHSKAHGSLNRCVAALLAAGVLAYDRETKTYVTKCSVRGD